MSKEIDRVGQFSRRNFLKTGTMFALLPSVHLAANEIPVPSADPSQPASPEWLKDLVLYEIATKGFTSPNGPESGPFLSVDTQHEGSFKKVTEERATTRICSATPCGGRAWAKRTPLVL